MQVKSPWMPLFSKSHSKHMARELHIGFLFPLITGNLSIPAYDPAFDKTIRKLRPDWFCVHGAYGRC